MIVLDFVRARRPDLEAPPPFVPGKTLVPATAPTYGPEEIANAVEAALEFRPAAGRWARRLENALERYFGGRALLVNSGSSANLLAIATLMSPLLDAETPCDLPPRLQPGDEVITVAAAFPTTVAPIVRLGMTPVFVDVKEPDYNVDPAQLEAAISPKTRAVVLAHTLGFPFNVERVVSFCNLHNLWLVEDNCDAFGASFRRWKAGVFRKTGTFGDLATLSFYPAHQMTTGEGGALLVCENGTVARRALLARIATSLRDWGRDCYCMPGRDNTCGKRFAQSREVLGDLPDCYDHKYVYSHLGFNLKLTDMQAAIGCAQIERIDKFVEARIHNWIFYRNALADLEDRLLFSESNPHAVPSPFGFLVTVREKSKVNREELVRALEAKQIATRPLFAGNLLRHPAMHGVKHRVVGGSKPTEWDTLPVTDAAMRRAFWIGVGPWLTEAMRSYVVQTFQGLLT